MDSPASAVADRVGQEVAEEERVGEVEEVEVREGVTEGEEDCVLEAEGEPV